MRDGRVLMGRRRSTEFAAGQYHVPARRLEADGTVAYARQAIADILTGRRLGLFGWSRPVRR